MPYRVELSKSGRAGCKNKECKDNGIKINKDELRFGTWVTIQEKGTWAWKHWGCVTPSQIKNVSDAIEGDFEQLDGFDEIPEDLQDKVKRSVEQGHVDNEDWKGDPECNVPGSRGMRKPAPRKKAGKEEKDDEEAAAEPQQKKRGRKSDDAEEEAQPKKKKAATKKQGKTKVEEELDETEDEGESAPTKKASSAGRKGKARKAHAEDEEDAIQDVKAPVKKDTASTKGGRGRRSTKTKDSAVEVEDPAENQEENPPARTRRSRRKAA